MTHTVLIIEDEPDLAGLLTDILQSAGYAVAMSTGTRAVARVGEVKPAAVVLDYSLPGMNGGEVLRQLRLALQEASPPVVLVTGLPNIDELAARSGADAYLRKPFDLDEFLDTVAGVIAGTRG